MLCFRCGSYNVDDANKCSVCGQTFEVKAKEGEAAAKRPLSSTRIQAQIFLPGEVVGGRYKIIDELGRSGVGVVYRAYDQEIDADVALKAISPNLLQTDEERKLFAREAKAARKLHHPNIVRIYEEGAKGDQRYFTMKLLEGLTLRKIISLRHEKGQSFSTEEIVPIMHQIAAALDYAHKTTWHGDLKPENVIILPDLLKLTDFNIVKGLPLKPFLGIAKSRSNTYAYVAPELKVEAQQIDGRCDIFSLGVILGEMLTGLVYDGHFTRAFATALERLPPKVDGLVRRAVSEHPDGRFQTASELATELESALELLIGGALPPPVRTSAQAAAAAKPPPPPEETQASSIDHTQEDLGVADDPSLEEIGASQVILLDSDPSPPADEWDHDTDMARKRPQPVSVPTQEGRRRRDTSQESTPGLGPAVTSQEVSRDRIKAEDLGDVLYNHDEDLVPPPLPSDERLNRSESFESLPPDGIAVSGASDLPDFLGAPTVDDSPHTRPVGPVAIAGDLSEEPTRTDGGGGIHDALTALKDHPRPDLVSDPNIQIRPPLISGDGAGPKDRTRAVVPPPPVLDDGVDEMPDSLPLGGAMPGREVLAPQDMPTQLVPRPSPSEASHLPPPVVAPVPVTAKVQRPVAPPKEKKKGGGVLIAAGVFLMLIIFGLVGWQVSERLQSGKLQIGGLGAADAGQATPIDVVSVDAGVKVAVVSPEAAPETVPTPEAPPSEPEAKSPETNTPDTNAPEATAPETPQNESTAAAIRRKNDDKEDARRKKEAEAKARRDEEERKAEANRKKEAERQAREEMEAREREERAVAKREREDAAKAKKEEERNRAAEAKRKKEEEKRLADEAAAKAAALAKAEASKKTGECPRSMRKIPAGSFKFGSSTSDPMRNFGEKIATTVQVGEYCIDYYEYPNSKSKKPVTGVSWSQAKATCARRGKRLCTEVEWERACKGTSGSRFPYGNTFRDGVCNTEDAEGVARGIGAGVDFPRCRSGFTVINMAGNAEEWTADAFKDRSSSMTVKGGASDRPDFASRCAARRGASRSTTRATLGFRCCADVQ